MDFKLTHTSKEDILSNIYIAEKRKVITVKKMVITIIKLKLIKTQTRNV